MRYDEWIDTVSGAITDDVLWRMRVLAEIIKMLLVIVRRQRTHATHEPPMSYTSNSNNAQPEAPLPDTLRRLLNDMPSP